MLLLRLLQPPVMIFWSISSLALPVLVKKKVFAILWSRCFPLISFHRTAEANYTGWPSRRKKMKFIGKGILRNTYSCEQRKQVQSRKRKQCAYLDLILDGQILATCRVDFAVGVDFWKHPCLRGLNLSLEGGRRGFGIELQFHSPSCCMLPSFTVKYQVSFKT